MPKLNHLFMAGEGEPNAAEYNVAKHADPSVIDKLSAFVLAPPPHIVPVEAATQAPDQPAAHAAGEGAAAGHGQPAAPTHDSGAQGHDAGTPSHDSGTSQTPAHDPGTSPAPTHDAGTPSGAPH
jgi:hypothetical protein